MTSHAVCRNLGPCAIASPESTPQATVLPVLAPDTPHTIPREDILRPIMSQSEAEELVSRVPYLRTLSITADKHAPATLQAALDTYDPIEWVKAVKTAHIRRQHGKARQDEAPIADQLTAFLHAELALALSIPYDTVTAHIEQSIADEF